MKIKRQLLLGAVLATLSSTSSALEWITGNVLVVEPTYLPNVVSFQLDAGKEPVPDFRTPG